MKTFDNILARLKSQGVRITKTRKLLLHIVISAARPFTAEELVKQLHVNKTTIYRELEFLKQQGIILELDFGEGKKRYEPDNGHHHHIVCTHCSRIEHVEVPDDLQSIERQISRSKKFRITSHTLEFFGLCKNCQK